MEIPMKSKVLATACLVLAATQAHGICQQSNLTGTWGGSLASSVYAHASACLVAVAPGGSVSGACYDSLSFEAKSIESGRAAVGPDCIATFTLNFEDFTTANAIGLLSQDRGTVVGTYNDSTDDTGSFSIVKPEP
jgi:hypothetical protein